MCKDTGKSTTAFVSSILRELSFLGRFAAFFGTLLLLVSIPWPAQATVLLGLSLALFAISNSYWRHRYEAALYAGEKIPWYTSIRWGQLFLAMFFFLLSTYSCYLWVRLPTVEEFWGSAGVFWHS